MSNLLDEFELAGLREDFYEMLGLVDEGGNERSIVQAKTLVVIRRVIERGDINPTTKKYDSPSLTTIYAGPSDFSPVRVSKSCCTVFLASPGSSTVLSFSYKGLGTPE